MYYNYNIILNKLYNKNIFNVYNQHTTVFLANNIIYRLRKVCMPFLLGGELC